ncbi:enoyl-CoA hydratase [Paraburkholderia sp. BL10I2N1]|uniref:enoyl-CoA hydratase n=1 Tax=Paraburkholderia sp. BL10I2N1 TaxID=1938796 RepID=UPI001061F639|nr:enoyl-CoA hydratase [Paraburkholderia sp. BL10I2N1]TDN59246.1 enoyl-CoA hydratase [Paraburkholderia sp. BL10I2N1]
MRYETILYDVKDRIATVTLNRPEHMNTWNDQVATEVYEAMQAAGADRGVRVIVFTGAGKAFCAGGDIHSFGGDPHALMTKLPRPFDMRKRADWQTRCSYYPAIPKPVIAMLNGATVGIGLIHALFCDIRFAAEDATITTAFARRGLTAEYGMAWILSHHVGHARALDLLLSARKIKGLEAERMGLVNRAFPSSALADETYAYARDLAENCSPRSMRVMKAQLWEVPFQTPHEAIMSAGLDMPIANQCDDYKEGIASFLEKRKPNFADD